MSNEGSNHPGYNTESDEISLREIILQVQEYFVYIFRNWKVLLYFIVPLFFYLTYLAFVTPKKYTGELSFMVNEDEGSQLGGVADVLESIGLAGGTTNSEYNLDKILELAKSRRILSIALMKKGMVNDEEDYYANHIIKNYELHKKWKRDKPKLVDFYFTRDSIPSFNRLENSAMKYIIGMLLGKQNDPPILTTAVLENSGIMSMEMVSVSEQLSVQLLNTIFRELSEFYIRQSTEKQRDIYEKVHQETDSLRMALLSKEYELASFNDKNQGLITQRAQVRKDQLSREVFLLNTMYSEAASNEEVAKFTLKKKTPFIQAIDTPTVPLKLTKPSLAKNTLLAVVLGLIFGGLFLAGRKLYLDAMKRGTFSEEASVQ